MGIEETVARLRRQASEAQQRHAVAGGQHVQAQARAGALREDLKTEFGVATVAEAQVCLADLEAQLESEAAEIMRQLQAAGGAQ